MVGAKAFCLFQSFLHSLTAQIRSVPGAMFDSVNGGWEVCQPHPLGVLTVAEVGTEKTARKQHLVATEGLYVSSTHYLWQEATIRSDDVIVC